jgi:methylthioribose-1-phosphate isomerase
MADDNGQHSRSTPGVTGTAAVLVVGIVTIAIAAIVIVTIDRYEDSADAVAVLTAVVAPLAGLGAAAFGVRLQISAKEQTAKAKGTAQEAADVVAEATRVGAVETRGGPPAPEMERMRELEQRLRRLSR